jgi:preprotein translocase subunit SecA
MNQSVWHWIKTAGRTNASRWRSHARLILRRADDLQQCSDEDFTGRARELAWNIRSGYPLQRSVIDVFSMVCEAARRTVNMLPYEVQVMGALAISEQRVAEMQTGEGKTLTGTLPVSLYAMAGKGCHVVTVNDYLANRDAELMRPVYELMGLTVGCVDSDQEPDQRREAYACDITYGTANEIGFDFLRDRLQSESVAAPNELPRYASGSSGGRAATVQRGHFFALIDEVDSVLIDDAGTPLIIALPEPNSIPVISLLHWANSMVPVLADKFDYESEPDRRQATLTEQGAKRVLMSARPQWLRKHGNEQLLSQVETAIAAHRFYNLDREYVVNDGAVTIVDESTGRMMEGRKWQRGLHHAVEVKEGVQVTENTHHAAQITIQTFYRRYRYLAGMTGTAVQAKRELKKVYRIGVSAIPTNRPCIRTEVPSRVFTTDAVRNAALVDSVVELVRQKRAVLIGTPSVNASEELGRLLNSRSVRHITLNARHEAEEAGIIKNAGRPGQVTIATNMAGRGTDIIPHKDVVANGGVHVIATSIHSSARIDRQLVGRTARQGDPGSFQFLLSLEDQFLRVLTERTQKQLTGLLSGKPQELSSQNPGRYFRKAQRQLERIHLRMRKQMLKSEQQQQETFRRIGLDPYLECAGD